MEQTFYADSIGGTQQQALAQQDRYVQQANLVAARADQQAAQDNAFAFQARNQLANEESQRYQFARQDAANAANAAVQDRSFFANQAQNRAQEDRLNAQSKREDEKFQFDKGRVQRDEKQRFDNSGFLTDAFAKSIGYTQTELDKADDALSAARPEYDALIGKARELNLNFDRYGQLVPATSFFTGSQAETDAKKFMAESGAKLSGFKQIVEARNAWEAKRNDLEAQGMKDRLFVSGNRATGMEVFDGFTGVRKQALAAPAPRPETPPAPPAPTRYGASQLDIFVKQLNEMPVGTPPGGIKAFKSQVREAAAQGLLSEAAAQALLNDARIASF